MERKIIKKSDSEDNRPFVYGERLHKNFHNEVRIDPDSLDEEYMRLGQTIQTVSDELAFAISRRDLAKLDVKKAIAELDTQIRQKPSDGRVTDTAVLRQIEKSTRIIDLEKKVIEANEIVSRLFGIKESFQVKTNALDYMVKLYSTSYFARTSGQKGERELGDVTADHARSVAGLERRKRMPE